MAFWFEFEMISDVPNATLRGGLIADDPVGLRASIQADNPFDPKWSRETFEL